MGNIRNDSQDEIQLFSKDLEEITFNRKKNYAKCFNTRDNKGS